jgi:hypothetical protein
MKSDDSIHSVFDAFCVQTCPLYITTSMDINFTTILITYYQILFGNRFYSC